jgi:hypothetical protein
MLKGSVIGAVMITVSSLLGLVVVKRFQTFSSISADVARRSALLFGMGTEALP